MKKEKVTLNKNLSATTLIFILLFFNECTTIYCPAFYEEFKAWFPYEINQELCFKSETADSISINVDNYYTSPAHSYKSNCDCDCSNYMEFVLKNTLITNVAISGYINGFEVDSSNVPYIDITIRAKDYFFYKESSYGKYYDSLYIQDKLYYDVLTIENSKGNSGYNYSEIQVVKNYGIMSISDYEGNTWYLELDE